MRQNLLKAALAACAVLGPAAVANAEWHGAASTDPLTGRKQVSAYVSAEDAATRAGASLHLNCNYDTGMFFVSLHFDEGETFGPISLRYRLDERAVESRVARYDRSGAIPVFGLGLERLRKAHRIRMQVGLPRKGNYLFDFDLSGIETVLRTIACRP